MRSYEYDIDIVPMSKRELAQLYAPELTPHAAVNRLMVWINRHPLLLAELMNAGYKKTSKILSAVQVGLIVEYLGAP